LPLPPLAALPGLVAGGSARLFLLTAKGLGWLAQWSVSSLHCLVFEPDQARASVLAFWADYWAGTKLFVAELSTSAGLVRKVGRGAQLTRRERLQLTRSMSDVLRLAPFVVILVVPFAEFGLPVILRYFPKLLPSQFETAELRQQSLRNSLAVRIELQGLLQETLADMVRAAKEQRGGIIAWAKGGTAVAGGGAASSVGAAQAGCAAGAIESLGAAAATEARVIAAAAAPRVDRAAVADAKLALLEEQNKLIRAEEDAAMAESKARKAADGAAAADAAAAAAAAPPAAAKVVRMRAADAALAAVAVPPPSPEAAAAAQAPASLRALSAGVAQERELLRRLREVRPAVGAGVGVAPAAGGSGSAAGGSGGAAGGGGVADDGAPLFVSGAVAQLGEALEREVVSASVAGQLAMADADADGSVTRMELIAALKAVSAGDAAAVAAAAHIEARLDASRDGSLAIDDVERFLGELAARVERDAQRAAPLGAAAGKGA